MIKKIVIGSLVSKGIISVGAIIFIITVAFMPTTVKAESTEQQTLEVKAIETKATVGHGLKYISAAAAVGIAAIAGGLAVAGVGSAAMGAVVERPELFGRSLIYVGLAEGIAIYGMVVAILILIA